MPFHPPQPSRPRARFARAANLSRRPVLRKLIIAMSAVAFAVPAAAQPRPDPRDEEMVRRLPPPGEIEELGDRLGRVADAVMDVPVGPVIDAVDPYRRHRRHREETLGDIASRDDPYARERIRGSIGAATYGLEAAIRQLAILTPVLRRSIEDAEPESGWRRSEEHTSELQSQSNLVCRLLLEKKKHKPHQQ